MSKLSRKTLRLWRRHCGRWQKGPLRYKGLWAAETEISIFALMLYATELSGVGYSSPRTH